MLSGKAWQAAVQEALSSFVAFSEPCSELISELQSPLTLLRLYPKLSNVLRDVGGSDRGRLI